MIDLRQLYLWAALLAGAAVLAFAAWRIMKAGRKVTADPQQAGGVNAD